MSAIRFFTLTIFLFNTLALPLRGDPLQAETPKLKNVTVNENNLILELSQLVPYDVSTMQSPSRLLVEIPGTLYQAGFSKKNVSSNLVKRVRGYQYRENPLITRVVFDLNGSVDYSSTAEGGTITIALRKNILSSDAEQVGAKSAKPTVKKESRRDLLASLPKEEVTLDFEGADIRDVIRLMAETSNINIIFGPEVAGNISIHLKRVPFDEAFSTILNLKGLVASQLGTNILRVTTPDLLQKERQKAVVFTKTIPINYLKADEVQSHVLSVMNSAGRKGSVSTVRETNSLVITDSEEGLAQAERLIVQLDKKPKQVMIEARIVEINLNNGFDIGVRWEFFNSKTKDGQTRTIGLEEGGAASGPDAGGTGVGLPGPTQAGISFGFVNDDSILSAQIAALVTQSRAKILSAPKVVTVNGQTAKIEAVQDIRFLKSTVSNGVVTSDFETVPAGIVLSVTPTINAEDRVTLKIQPESSFPTQDSTEAGPIIRTRSAQTTVIIKDGETLVIGGLIDDQDTKGVSKVPILGDIPIIGIFFKSNTNRKIRNELLVLVTPRIIKD